MKNTASSKVFRHRLYLRSADNPPWSWLWSPLVKSDQHPGWPSSCFAPFGPRTPLLAVATRLSDPGSDGWTEEAGAGTEWTRARRTKPASSSPSPASPHHRAPRKEGAQNPVQRCDSAESSWGRAPSSHLDGRWDGTAFCFLHPFSKDRWAGVWSRKPAAPPWEDWALDNRAAVFMWQHEEEVRQSDHTLYIHCWIILTLAEQKRVM